MNPRIIKEIRPLLPAFALTLCGLMITCFAWHYFEWVKYLGVGVLLSAFGCILMGIATFGDEFGNRTMPLLLSQPFSRRAIWREKMTALAMAIGVLSGVVLIYIRIFVPENIMAIVPVIVFGLGVFCTAPFATLALKNIPAAVVSVIVMPVGLGIIAGAIFDHLPTFRAQHDNKILEAAFLLLFQLPYFVVCYWAGRHIFLNLEAVDVQGPDIALPAGLEQSLARPFKALVPQFTGPWSSLINKELHLQRLNFLLAAIFCILVPPEYFAWKFSTWEMETEIAVGLLGATFVIYVILIPLIAGAGCIAEEKNWKIHEWHLTLPPSKLKQWVAKVLVALGITLVLGILLPAIFLAISNHWHQDFAYVALFSLSAVCLGIFASSVSSNSMRAIILTLVLFGLGTAAAVSANAAATSTPDNDEWSVVTTTAVVLLCAAFTLILFLAYLNYRTGATSARRAWTHSVLILATIWVVTFIVTFLADFFTEQIPTFHLS